MDEQRPPPERKEPAPEETPRHRLKWNLVGWFGASVGATAWMIITPIFLTWPTSGVFAGLVGTLLIWSFSSVAWALRARISAFRGLVGLLCITVLANLSFLLFAHLSELPLTEEVEEVASNYGLYYIVLLVLFLSLLIFFWLRENDGPQ